MTRPTWPSFTPRAPHCVRLVAREAVTPSTRTLATGVLFASRFRALRCPATGRGGQGLIDPIRQSAGRHARASTSESGKRLAARPGKERGKARPDWPLFASTAQHAKPRLTCEDGGTTTFPQRPRSRLQGGTRWNPGADRLNSSRSVHACQRVRISMGAQKSSPAFAVQIRYAPGGTSGGRTTRSGPDPPTPTSGTP